MSLRKKVLEETKAVVLTTLYFAAWFLMLMLLKKLVLEEYKIAVTGVSAALVGALIVAKTVLILEHVRLFKWVREQAAVVEVTARTLLYTVGAWVLLVLEKVIEVRHEYAGVGDALANIFHHRDMPHVWVNTICIGSALLGFNVLAIFRRAYGDKEVTALFFKAPGGRKAG